MAKLISQENKILHEPATEVSAELFGTAKLKKIINQMSEILAKEDDGVALAAPQIGLPLKIFIVSNRIFALDNPNNPNPKLNKADLIFINPQITSLSKNKELMEEGCLSVRWFYGQVKRSSKATISAYDLDGKKFTYSGSGLLAQIFQHEMDHLNGVLFTSKTKKLTEYRPLNKK